MLLPGDIISYIDMCTEEGMNLQRGMNYRPRAGLSIILMSVRPDAPYSDRVERDGRILIYEGHDVSRSQGGPDPKSVDQPLHTANGTITANGLFYKAAMAYKQGAGTPELVKVYEKIRNGIWVFNGIFRLLDAWQEVANGRNVFKYQLELLDEPASADILHGSHELIHARIIPTPVKLEVWKRDGGRCVKCGSTDNLHFDHIIPFSKGGSSLVADNIQILCARHNLGKRDRIE